jgi:hypothetical protein
VAYATKHTWKKWFDEPEDPVSIAYAVLQRGQPSVVTRITSHVERTDLVNDVVNIITPRHQNRGYPIIIGERGTGKTSLLWLAVKHIEKSRRSKGIVYARIPRKDGRPFELSQIIGEALGLKSNRCK